MLINFLPIVTFYYYSVTRDKLKLSSPFFLMTPAVGNNLIIVSTGVLKIYTKFIL